MQYLFSKFCFYFLNFLPRSAEQNGGFAADILPIIFSMVRYILPYAGWLTFEKQIDMYVFRTIDEYSFHLYTYQLHSMRKFRVYLRYIESVVHKY